MHMQVIHRLTAISADVHNETVATFGDALLDGDLRGGRRIPSLAPAMLTHARSRV